jgi:hypothetical protein
LRVAREIVEEAGTENVQTVYEYKHSFNGEPHWAVFLKSCYVDIYESPFCLEPKLIFENGVWLYAEDAAKEGGEG